jgi:hypothetical protein
MWVFGDSAPSHVLVDGGIGILGAGGSLCRVGVVWATWGVLHRDYESGEVDRNVGCKKGIGRRWDGYSFCLDRQSADLERTLQ